MLNAAFPKTVGTFPRTKPELISQISFQAMLAFPCSPRVQAKMLPKRGQWQPQVVLGVEAILSFAVVDETQYPSFHNHGSGKWAITEETGLVGTHSPLP